MTPIAFAMWLSLSISLFGKVNTHVEFWQPGLLYSSAGGIKLAFRDAIIRFAAVDTETSISLATYC